MNSDPKTKKIKQKNVSCIAQTFVRPLIGGKWVDGFEEAVEKEGKGKQLKLMGDERSLLNALLGMNVRFCN
jgi:hypothetical protein